MFVNTRLSYNLVTFIWQHCSPGRSHSESKWATDCQGHHWYSRHRNQNRSSSSAHKYLYCPSDAQVSIAAETTTPRRKLSVISWPSNVYDTLVGFCRCRPLRLFLCMATCPFLVSLGWQLRQIDGWCSRAKGREGDVTKECKMINSLDVDSKIKRTLSMWTGFHYLERDILGCERIWFCCFTIKIEKSGLKSSRN